MTTDGTKPRRPRLSDDEHALWRVITRSIAPLKKRRAAPADPKPAPTARKSAAATPARAAGLPVRAASAPKKAALPLVPLERRLKQRLARGTETADARIDLHGQTQDRAHVALLQFLRHAQAEGLKMVLVITGKGATGDAVAGERGVLRRMVPHWLALAEFRAYVLSVEDAPIRQGGSGALIVRVRRARS
jgi:DNA-nicking Smr family endonuclease